MCSPIQKKRKRVGKKGNLKEGTNVKRSGINKRLRAGKFGYKLSRISTQREGVNKPRTGIKERIFGEDVRARDFGHNSAAAADQEVVN